MKGIPGDRQELSRIKLEQDINTHVPSPPSMSIEDIDDVDSVEFARHNSHPHHHSFHSFEHPSHFDSDFYSRHGDEDSYALDPELGHTMSTAAHHASALTLSAGLRGRGGQTTGRASFSGAEFDPERPLQGMLYNRIAEGISLFDATARSQSKSFKSKNNTTRSMPTCDPVVVDSTAELDRFLQTGHPASRTGTTHPYVSRSHSQPDPSAYDSDTQPTSPRLTQALGSQFSPKRPRSGSPSPHQLFHRPEIPSPRISHRSKSSNVHSLQPKSTKLPHSPSNLNPARYDSEGENKFSESRSSKPVRSLARNTDTQPRRLSLDTLDMEDKTPRPSKRGIFPSAPTSGPSKRAPFANIVNKDLDDPRRKTHRSSERVHLPDVTGLTSAVSSPVKSGDGYAEPNVITPSLAVDLISALDGLQTRLQTLERENSVSRRRVKELELELEECKAEVVAERTRIRERERKRDFDEEAQLAKEREKVRQMRGKMHEEENRYREVVEEKKALEALITSLRSHLSRLTAELASHRNLIEGLREDAYAAAEVRGEIEALRAEVERLAGEVERLKAVVEEGLRERRRAKDANISQREESALPSQIGLDLTYVTNPAPRGEEREEPMTLEDLEPEAEQEQDVDHDHAVDREEPQSESASGHSEPYIQPSELARVESEISERRLERSLPNTGPKSNPNMGLSSRSNDSGNGSSMLYVEGNPSLSLHTSQSADDQGQDQVSLPPRASSRARPSERPPPRKSTHMPSTPFPQIRGSRMERLFFSAPEHNARTCHVCHRRKHRQATRQDGDEEQEDDMLKNFLGKKAQRTIGTMNGDSQPYSRTRPPRMERRGASDGLDDDANMLPPQTVLARVVRELEDDFSHYKAIYLELAEQYGLIDAASNVAKRKVLADHLREVIDTLEQKGDQIASLYDLLEFQDKPLPRTRTEHTAFA